METLGVSMLEFMLGSIVLVVLIGLFLEYGKHKNWHGQRQKNK